MVAAVVIASTGLFTDTPIVQLSRPDVVAGPESLLGLDVANATCSNARDRLLGLRNNLGEPANVTVALIRSDAGRLYLDGQRGSAVTFDLIPGENETVAVAAANVSSIRFTVIARTETETSSTTRSVSVVDEQTAAQCQDDST